MNFALKKLWKEYNDINEKEDLPFTVGLIEEGNVFKWIIMIEGPESTIYEGGLFQAHIIFPLNYPIMPPKMNFVT